MLDLRRRGHMVDDEIEQRREVFARAVKLVIGPAGAAGRIHVRKIELVLVGPEIGEKIETFVKRTVRLGIGLVHLVEHHDGAQPEAQRLGRDKLGLRHRSLGGIDQQHDTVDHAQDALHLAAEIGVAGGVDDVDTGGFPHNRGGLGKDGDAALALDVVAVHRAFIDRLPHAKRAGLLEQFVHERCLAVVDMGDDGNIAHIHWDVS